MHILLSVCTLAGLDSFAALNVMEHMHDLAALGHTVIASIHQPRSAIWEMFDKVCASAHSGACAELRAVCASMALRLVCSYAC